MAEEPHNISLTPYHYTNNNPILFVDVNGEDWFVNGNTGVVVYFAGEEELNQDVIDNLVEETGNGVLYNLFTDGFDSWENLGDDEMFNSEDNKISEESGFKYMGDEQAREFMGEHGFEKTARQDIIEDVFTDYSVDDNGPRTMTVERTQVINSKITYVTRDQLGQGTKRTTEYINFGGKIVTTRYPQVVPYDSSTNSSMNFSKGKGQEAINVLLKSFWDLYKALK